MSRTHTYQRNLAHVERALGQMPEGELSQEQAVAILEHLAWLNGKMPSERIAADRAERQRQHEGRVES